MKKLLPCLLLVMLFCNPGRVNAQWVTIPAAFANYIKTYVTPAAISGSQLDTTNAIVLGVANMTITDNSVTDITGIQYFKGLLNLVVYGQLVSFPQLPANLNSFDSEASTAASFGAPLPVNLFALKVYNNGYLTALPALPSTLRILILQNDGSITGLPVLPAGLLWLSVNNCFAIATIPAVPASVYHLDLSYDQALTLPALPQSLTYLNLSQSSFGPLTGFEATLDTFICSYCANITSLPNVAPPMTFLALNHCNINSTGTMPNGMLDLILTANPLSTIPYLPDTIYETLQLDSMPNLATVGADSIYVGLLISMNDCPQIGLSNGGGLPNFVQNAHNAASGDYLSINANSDNISSFSQFNAYIYNLDLSYNSITDIGYQGAIVQYYVPGCNSCGSMQYADSINFSHNQLGFIDQNFFAYQSSNLQYLNFNNNGFGQVTYTPTGNFTLLMDSCQITGFDASLAVGAYYLDLGNNPSLYCLPYLSGTVYTLITTGSPAVCVPDIPSIYFYSDQALGLCQTGNAYGCPVSPEAGGIIFSDTNQNGYLDAGEKPIPGFYVAMQPGNFLHVSDTAGHYLFQCQPLVTYNIYGVSVLPYRTLTTQPYSAFFTAFGADTFDNIGVYTHPNINDMEVFITPYELPRPGFHQDYDVTAWNVGTTTENGQVTMYFNSTLSYQSSIPAGTVNGNSVTWNLSNLAPGVEFNAYVDFIVPVPVPLGTPVSAGLHAFCNTPDSTPLDNSDTITGIAYGSYDPNSKTVSPAGPLAREQIASGGYLTYTVRFQNTGTGSAVNITVLDTLDPNLDISSFQFITASNKYTWSIDSGVLSVTFSNINLPDSAQSEPGSHGFFEYRIKAVGGLTPGVQIKNSASIYFDFNAPVATNTDTTVITTFFPSQPQSQVLCSGEPLLLTTAVNSSVISLQWYKNGHPTGITSDSIYVASSSAANNGNYYVRILASDGKYYNSSTVGVNIVTDTTTLPTFNITNHGVVTGCSNSLYYTTFSIVNLQNSPPYQYFSWYLNDSLLQGSTQQSFSWYHHYKNGDRLSCYPRTGGCQNPNMAHGDSAVFVIKSADTLQLVSTPRVSHICRGADITLHTRVANPELQLAYFNWIVNGQTFSGGDSLVLSAVDSNTVVVVKADTTQFICSVLCSLNGRNLANDTLYITVDSVGPPPAGQLAERYGSYFCPGSNSGFAVQGSNLGVLPYYIWVQNNIQVGITVLPYYNSSAFQTGDVIQCQVPRNICGVIDTVYSNPIVLGPDSAFMPQLGVYVQSTGSCTLQATLYAQPENAVNNGSITYYWYQNGTLIDSAMYLDYAHNFNRSSSGKADTILLVMNTGVPCYPVDSSIVILPAVGSGHFNINRYQPDTLCAHHYVQFYAPVADTTIWFKNGRAVDTLPPGQYFYVANDSADFSLYVLTKVRPCNGLQVSDTIEQYYTRTLTNPVITINAPSSYCANNVPQFTATSNLPSANYYWYLNGSYYAFGSSFYPTGGVIYNNQVLVLEVATSAGCTPAPGTFYDTVILNSTLERATIKLDTGLAILCGANHGQTFTVQTTYAGSYPGYRWYLNGQQVGTNSSTYYDANLNAGDKIYCILNSDNPCAEFTTVTSDTLVVHGGSPVTPVVAISALSTVCSGTPATFTATGTNGGGAPVYQWQINGSNAGSNSSTFSTSALNNNDVVSCILTSSLACVTTQTAASNTDTVKVYTSPVATVTPQGPATVCQGDSVTLMANTAPAYLWSNSATTQSVTVKQTGNFTVTVTDAHNCSASASQAVQVNQLVTSQINGSICSNQSYNFHNRNLTQAGTYYDTVQTVAGCDSAITLTLTVNNISVPTIVRSNDTLKTQAYNSYQWLMNGSTTGGATQSIVITQNGNYSVVVTSAGNCTDTSQILSVTTLGLKDAVNGFAAKLYPNPNNGSFMLVIDNDEVYDIQITDLLGREITAPAKVSRKQDFDLSNAASGIYIISILQNQQQVQRIKFSVVK